MLDNKVIAIFLALSMIALTGCGASESGAGSSEANIASQGSTTSPSDTTTESAPIILEQPSSAEMFESQSITFHVDADGENLSYRWQKQIDGSWVDLHNANTPSLQFSYLTTVDEGHYRVRISNDGGAIHSDSFQLIVEEMLDFQNQPQPLTLISGQDASFYVSLTSDSASEEAAYQWYKDNVALTDNSTYDGANSANLIVNQIDYAEAGVYHVVVNVNGITLKSDKVSLGIVYPVAISGHPEPTIDIRENQTALLAVNASGTSIEFEWQKLNEIGVWEEIPGATNASYTLQGNGSNAGSYRCIVSNSISQQASTISNVSISYPARIVDQPSDHYASQEERVLGDSMTFETSATGTDVSIEWYLGDTRLATTGNRLDITSISNQDTGIYRCYVHNSFSSAWCNGVEVVVLTPPTISAQPEPIREAEGEISELVVEFSGSPIPRIQWYKDGEAINGATSSTLTFAPLELSDAGEYSCIVENSADEVNCESISVQVLENVRITQQPSNQVLSPGSDITLTVEATGDSPLVYEWYKNNALYIRGENLTELPLTDTTPEDAGLYRVVVSNQHSYDETSNINLTILQDDSGNSENLTLSWSRPEKRAGGLSMEASEVDGYAIYHSNSPTLTSFQRLTLVDPENTSYTATDLAPGQHYFMIKTIDINGLESYSSSIIAYTVAGS
ncbi:MAG: immunoglobulin domain-containing protein [Pseudomonadales bacterium]|nr:immunoglobulin domain-containing protein [Pseudomonadales bacterium]